MPTWLTRTSSRPGPSGPSSAGRISAAPTWTRATSAARASRERPWTRRPAGPPDSAPTSAAPGAFPAWHEVELKPGAERIIVALDTAEIARAVHRVRELGGLVGAFKLGLEFLHGAGPQG